MNHPPAGHTRILAWMCVFIGVNQLGFGSVMPVLALYARSFDVGQSAIGLAIAIYGLARLLVAVPAGQIADRAGRRGALALGGLVTAASNLLCACAPTYPAFITARFIDGAGVRAVRVGHLVLGALDYRQSPKRIMDTSLAEHVVPRQGQHRHAPADSRASADSGRRAYDTDADAWWPPGENERPR
jgi:hypothetical protein